MKGMLGEGHVVWWAEKLASETKRDLGDASSH